MSSAKQKLIAPLLVVMMIAAVTAATQTTAVRSERLSTAEILPV